MPNSVIPNAARQMLETLAARRSQWEIHMHNIECELEEIDAEVDRLTTLISAYDKIERQAHGPVDTRPAEAPVKLIICYDSPEYNSQDNSTTENMTFTARVKQAVLMYPGTAADIAVRIDRKPRDISNRLTKLAQRGEIAHWPDCHMWGPFGWIPPTEEGQSNA